MRLLSLQSFCCLVLPWVGKSSCSCNCMKCFMVMAVGYSAVRAFKELNSSGKSCQLLLRDCKVFYKAFSHNRDWKSSTVVSEKLKKEAVFLAMNCKLCESETLSQYASSRFFCKVVPSSSTATVHGCDCCISVCSVWGGCCFEIPSDKDEISSPLCHTKHILLNVDKLILCWLGCVPLACRAFCPLLTQG